MTSRCVLNLCRRVQEEDRRTIKGSCQSSEVWQYKKTTGDSCEARGSSDSGITPKTKKLGTERPAPGIMPKAETLGAADSSDVVVPKAAPLASSQLRKRQKKHCLRWFWICDFASERALARYPLERAFSNRTGLLEHLR